ARQSAIASGRLRRPALFDRLLVACRQRRHPGRRAAPAPEREAQLAERDQVAEAVLPEIQLALADAVSVVDRHLEAADLGVGEGEDLELLRQRHAVALGLDAIEDLPPEDPHPGLRVDQEAPEEHHRGARQDRVAEKPQGALRLVVLRAPATRRHEVDLLLEEHVEEQRDRVGRIGPVTVHGHDDVAAGVLEARAIGAAVALAGLVDDATSERPGDLRRAIGGRVVDHQDLVDDRGHLLDGGADALLLVVARDDDGDALASEHGDLPGVADALRQRWPWYWRRFRTWQASHARAACP